MISVNLKKLPCTFYDRDTQLVARELLGKYLVHRKDHETRIGMIVETEAYIGEHDLASHSAKGLTNRTRIMFGEAGHLYVYLIYGMYYCANVVTEREGHGSAVLLRALAPVENLEGRSNGPGLLCRAMNITKALNGHDLLSDDFYIAELVESEKPVKHKVIKRPRIGVAYAKHWAKRLLRFYIKDNPYVSKK